jgi:cbb3-type cytochrome oxidase maturation protein
VTDSGSVEMSVILLLIPLSIVIAACFLGAFVWAVRSGQYEDTCTPAMRVLLEEAAVNSSGGLASLNEFQTSAAESQPDSIYQPRVASPRATLGPVKKETTLKGLRHKATGLEQNDATPLGLKRDLRSLPRVGAQRANPGLSDAIPLGYLKHPLLAAKGTRTPSRSGTTPASTRISAQNNSLSHER